MSESDSPTQAVLHAIIPAAGSGQRMRAASNHGIAKQYLPLGDKTILEHSLETFLQSDLVQSVVVCLAANDEHWPTLHCSSNAKIIATLGGETRAHSVLNGLIALESVAQDHDWVLVHDAARPCFNQSLLTRLINELANDSTGGILAVRARDTLKLSDAQNIIEQTLDRSQVWQAQTPQMFRYSLLKNSLKRALDNNAAITDEASAIELAGHKAKLVEGDAGNIKVTTIDDLPLAEFLLNSQQIR